jgi:hypothetical protein
VPTAAQKRTVRAVYWSLLRQSFDDPVALNLTAIEFGIEPCVSGWTQAELARCLWMRWLVDHRKIER